MKFHVLLLSVLICAFSSFAQSQSRKIVSTPTLQPPPEATESGLGGRVNVEVGVNKTGDVTEVKQVAGPGWVCPKVKRPDVLAIQETAKTVSMQVKFAPDDKASTEWIGITFPSAKKEDDLTADGSKQPADGSKRPMAPSGVTVHMKRPRPRMINGGIVNGKALSLPKPPYPPEARGARASGAVSIKVLIEEDGQVFSAEPVAGHKLLLAASRWAACGAEFSPTKLEGKTVKVTGVITYNFVP